MATMMRIGTSPVMKELSGAGLPAACRRINEYSIRADNSNYLEAPSGPGAVNATGGLENSRLNRRSRRTSFGNRRAGWKRFYKSGELPDANSVTHSAHNVKVVVDVVQGSKYGKQDFSG